MEEVSKVSLTNWNKSEISMNNYQDFLNRKLDKFDFSILDLLYISNFKGGNATINEEENELSIKLKTYYSPIFNDINDEFGDKSLKNLSDKETERLCELSSKILDLTKSKLSAIDGFKTSFLSTLLHAVFPNLYPILDRRLLINMEIVREEDLTKDKQVKKIDTFYSKLIKKVQSEIRNNKLDIRELDKKYFKINLPIWAK